MLKRTGICKRKIDDEDFLPDFDFRFRCVLLADELLDRVIRCGIAATVKRLGILFSAWQVETTTDGSIGSHNNRKRERKSKRKTERGIFFFPVAIVEIRRERKKKSGEIKIRSIRRLTFIRWRRQFKCSMTFNLQ